MGEDRPRNGFFRRAFLGGFFGALGVLAAFLVVIAVMTVLAVRVFSPGDEEGLVVLTELTPAREEPEVLNLSIGDTAKVGDAEVTVHGFRTSTGSDISSPDAGNMWIIVDATVRNTGDDSYALSSLLQVSARDSEGREYSITVAPDLAGRLDGAIPPGDMLRGEEAFEVPEGATGLQFVFSQEFGTQQARWNLE